MKRLTLAVLALLTFAFTNAQEQTKKGKWLFEANTIFGPGSEFNSDNGYLGSLSYKPENRWVDLRVEGGYFVIDNLALKAGLSSGNTFDSALYNVATKYYISGKFPVELSYNGSTSKYQDYSCLGIQGGYAWFVSKKISIEPSVRYNVSLNNYAQNFAELNIGFALHL